LLLKEISLAQPKWYLEDFEVGKVIQAGSRSVTEEEIIAFAKEFDPQPFHVDPVAARASVFGGIIASGWHTSSMIMRLMADSYLNDAAALGSPGSDQIRWLKPVRGGDTLTATSTVVEVVPSKSKPDRGVVRTRWEAKNQHGEVVATIDGMMLCLRRPA
jgi:acyl dehydratase